MPKGINQKARDRCLQQMLDHALEYPSQTAAAEVVGKRNRVSGETLRRGTKPQALQGCLVARAEDLVPIPRMGLERPAWRLRVAPGSTTIEQVLDQWSKGRARARCQLRSRFRHPIRGCR